MKKSQVIIKAIDYFLPEKQESNKDLAIEHPDWDMDKIVEKTGIHNRYISSMDQCASDLGVEAANKLIRSEDFDPKKINVLIYCTQSPDYFLPTTACVMQERLHLSTSVAAFDINLGCSGYIYGLALGTSLIQSGFYENALLVFADTYTKYIAREDRACRPLFSDAGAATLLVKSDTKDPMGPFVLGTDGKGAENLIVHGGAARQRETEPVIQMNGAEIFVFSMSQVSKSILELLSKADIQAKDIDHFFFPSSKQTCT